jgi:hypothetical protein
LLKQKQGGSQDGARGVPVVEILSQSSCRMHQLTSFAQMEGVRITYPPEQGTLP